MSNLEKVTESNDAEPKRKGADLNREEINRIIGELTVDWGVRIANPQDLNDETLNLIKKTKRNNPPEINTGV